MKTPSILICDDDKNVHESLRLYLEADGFKYTSAFNGEDALAQALSGQHDLMILDQMMPKLTGMEVLRELRKSSGIPVIVLTAKGEEIDRILGLELGADDYIVKPFSPREIIARIKAILRRMNESAQEHSNTLKFDNLEINLDHYQIRLNGEAVPCTPKEVEILHLLASRPGQVFDREQILSRVWGYDYFGDTRTVDTHIKRIRQKLPDEGQNWAVKTVYGVGYKFEVDL